MFEGMEVEDLLAGVAGHDFTCEPMHDRAGDRIDAIVALDLVIRAAQARQLAQIDALYAERVKIAVGSCDPALSVIGEVAMARNISPGAAGTQLTLVLGMRLLPRVAALLDAGKISESTARAVSRESVGLHADDYVILDAELATRLSGLTPGKAAMLTRHQVINIDADAARERAEATRADCRVSMFPEPDGVATLYARGPAEQILAAHQALDSWAQGLRASGDERTTGQIMTETLVERITGLAHADRIDIEIGLVMDAKTLIADGDEPVDLVGYGPIAPDVADDILARAHKTSIRRLLVDPVDNTLIARDPRRRRFDGPLGGFLHTRDRTCRQPGCECKTRHLDHIKSYEHGGLTSRANGQGLCERSHTLKHQPGWKVIPDGKATIWTTPTGHTYRSEPTPLLHRDAPGHRRQ
jgi:hypothetical protein